MRERVGVCTVWCWFWSYCRGSCCPSRARPSPPGCELPCSTLRCCCCCCCASVVWASTEPIRGSTWAAAMGEGSRVALTMAIAESAAGVCSATECMERCNDSLCGCCWCCCPAGASRCSSRAATRVAVALACVLAVGPALTANRLVLFRPRRCFRRFLPRFALRCVALPSGSGLLLAAAVVAGVKVCSLRGTLACGGTTMGDAVVGVEEDVDGVDG